MTELLIVGGGRMGEALLAGLLHTGRAVIGDVAVTEPVAERRAELAERFDGLEVRDALGDAEGVVLATKPGDVAGVCAALRHHEVGRVLSIAAGVSTATMEAAFGAPVPVVRAMPNTPALLGVGAAAIAAGAYAGEDELVWAEGILGSVGIVERVAEPALDAVTGLSGSGPAYVYLVAEALVDAGVLVGLPRPTAEGLVLQTLLGAARMLTETDRPAAQLRADVTSPGGTTAAGLHVLEAAGVRAAFADAVRAATARSVELGTSATKL